MEDDNGLELSLGLSFGGPSVKPKSKNGSSSDTRAEEIVRDGKMTDDFKNMFDAGPQKSDSVNDTQKTDSSKPEENFFSDLSKTKEDASLNLNGTGFWVANGNKPVLTEEDKQLDIRIKRKMSFDEINNQKKHESDVHRADLHDKTGTSHISMTVDGSAAKNEDVADSEAENSTSGPISHHDDGTRQFIRVGVSSETQKDVHGVAETSVTDFNGDKRFSNLTCGATLSLQQVNTMNVPYLSLTKESNSVHAPNPQISVVRPTATGELPGSQSVSNGSLPLMFDYSSVKLPTLDNTRGTASHSLQLQPAFAGRGPPDTAAICANSNNTSKQHAIEESSSQPEAMNRSITDLRVKNASEQSMGESSSFDFSFLKPGIAADVKFGGGGSCPNLPWVSTTGSGPNGKTISGVTYKFNTNQIRIVCACHGSHMTPEEFDQHANEGQTQANPAASANR